MAIICADCGKKISFLTATWIDDIQDFVCQDCALLGSQSPGVAHDNKTYGGK